MSLAAQHAHRVLHDGPENRHAQAHRLLGAGKVDDHRVSVEPRVSAGEHGGRVSASDAARNASAIPGSSFWQKRMVASGVTSRGEMPVPPVVRMKSAPANDSSAARMSGGSSGTTVRVTSASGNRARTSFSISGPDRSAYSPRDARSETVMTATLNVDLPSAEHARENSLARHDAVSHRLVDGAPVVTLLADLGDLEKRGAELQLGADGQ